MVLAQGHIEQCSNTADLRYIARSGTVTRRKVGDVYDISLARDHPLLARPGWPTIAQPFCQRLRETIRRHGPKFFTIVKLQRTAGDTAEVMRLLQDRIEHRARDRRARN